MDIIIKREEKKHYKEVEKVTREAFWNFYQPGANEHFLIHKLRKSEYFIPELTLIAEVNNEVVGSIFYTKASIVDKDENLHKVLSFGPLSVHVKHQNKGIGKKLILESMKLAKKLGHKAILIYGYPDYYTKFNFKKASSFGISSETKEFLQGLLAIELEDGFLQDKKGRFIEVISKLEEDINLSEFNEFDKKFPIKEKGYAKSQDRFLEMVSLLEKEEDIKR